MRKISSGAFASLLMLTACGQLGNNPSPVIDGNDLPQYTVPDGTPEGATAVMVTGSNVTDCTSLDVDGDAVADGMVWGYDEDEDVLAIIPISWTNIYEANSNGTAYYLCIVSGGAPIGYIGITAQAQVGADCDDAEASIGATGTYYADTDADGYGDPSVSVDSCAIPTGYVVDDTDCDDSERLSFPGNPEVCDDIDNNCDTSVDEGLAFLDYYIDSDADGYGAGSAMSECADPGTGYSTVNGDCNDVASPDVHPGATETCDGEDDNCDGAIDEGVLLTFHPDADSDTFGDEDLSTMACSAPVGYVSDGTDCNDDVTTGPDINPGADEICDTIDNDCDTLIDDLDADVTDQEVWYVDVDHDAYGIATGSILACEMPTSGYAAVNTDCDDTNANTHPGAVELCDSMDNDCNGLVDDGTATRTWYPDFDSDTYGNPSGVTMLSCTQPSGYVADLTDCDDNVSTTNPGATEILFNGEDDDCLVTTPATGDTTTATLCVTPVAGLMTTSWQLWLRDGTVDAYDTTATWDYPGASQGVGVRCANTVVTDGNVEYFNGPFDVDGDGIYGELASSGDGAWLYMNVVNEASATANGYAITIYRYEYDATTGASDGHWDVDLE